MFLFFLISLYPTPLSSTPSISLNLFSYLLLNPFKFQIIAIAILLFSILVITNTSQFSLHFKLIFYNLFLFLLFFDLFYFSQFYLFLKRNHRILEYLNCLFVHFIEYLYENIHILDTMLRHQIQAQTSFIICNYWIFDSIYMHAVVHHQTRYQSHDNFVPNVDYHYRTWLSDDFVA